MTRGDVIRFLLEKKRSKELHRYAQYLLKKYHVGIYEPAWHNG